MRPTAGIMGGAKGCVAMSASHRFEGAERCQGEPVVPVQLFVLGDEVAEVGARNGLVVRPAGDAVGERSPKLDCGTARSSGDRRANGFLGFVHDGPQSVLVWVFVWQSVVGLAGV